MFITQGYQYYQLDESEVSVTEAGKQYIYSDDRYYQVPKGYIVVPCFPNFDEVQFIGDYFYCFQNNDENVYIFQKSDDYEKKPKFMTALPKIIFETYALTDDKTFLRVPNS